MKNYPVTAFCLLVILTSFFGFCASSSTCKVENTPGDSALMHTHWITSPTIPEKVEFAGEDMPIHLFDVRESLERELIVNMNFHSNTLQYIKRISRYFPVIEPVLAENGIPDDFKYLSLIESDLMNKVSPTGATGFWQFMKTAATECGLEVNAEVDERYHIEKSTAAACKYLNEAHRIFGNWTMAAASYNMGKSGLSKQVKRQQCNYYYDLLLNDETMRYVYRIAAVKIIMNDPQKYGFKVPDHEKYQVIPYTEVAVKTAVADWSDFAFKYQTNYKMLKYLNPWLRDNKLTNNARKTYYIKIPAEGFRGDAQHRIDETEAEKIEEASEKSVLNDVMR
jgi:hypothetical protein